MASEIRQLWRGERRVIYAVETQAKIAGKRVKKVSYVSTLLDGWKWKKVSPRFGEQLERLMQGRLKALSPWLRSLIGADIKALEKSIRSALTGALRHVNEYARRLVDDLKEHEWAQLRKKASYIAKSVKTRMGIEFQVKGLIHEIGGIRRMFDPSMLTAEAKVELDRMRDIVKQAPDSHRWNPEIFMIDRAYTRAKTGGGEVGDKLFVVFRDPKDPKKGMWILGTGNQKSAGNAHHLLSHKSVINIDPALPDEGIPKYGEYLGQGSIDAERISELGVEIPGVGKFSTAPGPGEGKLKFSWRNCVRIGVVPPDTPQKVLDQLRNLANKEPNFRLLLSPLRDADAAKLASAVVDAVE
ncbi:MAG: hypothetical protein JNK68_10960 [Betaproteobacteria bacterium]|nr:hypothetical protein [Betaproteobacteria bacterium]